MKTIDETITFIKEAHKGQVDKSGIEYWKHPVAVMKGLPELEDANPKLLEELQHIALLHDVLEDTKYTEQDLKDMGYTDQIVDAVKLVTRTKDVTYNQFIDNIIDSGNQHALIVKISDMTHNMSDERFDLLSKEDKVKQKEMNENRYIPNLEKMLAVLMIRCMG